MRRGLRSPSEAGGGGAQLKPSGGEEVKELCSREVKGLSINRARMKNRLCGQPRDPPPHPLNFVSFLRFPFGPYILSHQHMWIYPSDLVTHLIEARFFFFPQKHFSHHWVF